MALLFGFLNAVGDLIEAEAPVIRRVDTQSGERSGPMLHIIRQRAELGIEREKSAAEGLEAFRSER